MFRRIQLWLFSNQSTKQTIVKNVFWLFTGQMLSRLLRAAIVIYAARLLGAAGWGAFSYALSIAAFLTIFSDIGINALITKEAARDPELKNQYLATAFFTKLSLVVIFALAILITFPYLAKIEEAVALMPIVIFVFAFDTLRELGASLSRALEKMQIEALTHIGTNLAIVVLGFTFLIINPTSQSLAWAYAAGSGLGLMAIIFILREHFRNLWQNFNRRLIKTIVITAWPFGLLSLMGTIMLNTDLIMLGWLRSPEEVGYYSAAQKLIQLLYIAPALLAASIFPILSRTAKTEPERARSILSRSVSLMLWISLPLMIIGIALGNFIVPLLFGAEYSPGITAFQILMLTVVLTYPATILGNAIFAYDYQKSFVAFVLVATVTNITLNFLFIPSLGIEGAAIATVLTQLITNSLIWFKAKKITGFRIVT